MTRQLENLHLVDPVFEAVSGVRAGFSRKAAYLHDSEREIPGLNVGYHTEAPASEVRDNRRRIYDVLGISESSVAWLRQIHSATVRHVTDGGEMGEGDALVTRTPGLALGIQVADCAALLLADPVSGVIGAAHAGWRGAVEGVVPRTLDTMVRLGADPATICAWVSPCISQERYEVGPDVARQFPGSKRRTGRGDRWMVDLRGLVRQQLLEFGLYESMVDLHPGCTVRDASSWYSYRREAERAGRMMALILLES